MWGFLPSEQLSQFGQGVILLDASNKQYKWLIFPLRFAILLDNLLHVRSEHLVILKVEENFHEGTLLILKNQSIVENLVLVGIAPEAVDPGVLELGLLEREENIVSVNFAALGVNHDNLIGQD